jgi:hypothetical protein
MPRRSETPAEREARDRVKHRYDAQLAAVNEFFTRERRIETLRADVATLEAEQGEATTKLVAATSVAQAAEILGWTQSRVREATGPRRRPGRQVGEPAASLAPVRNET